jgi:hypothetical protein
VLVSKDARLTRIEREDGENALVELGRTASTLVRPNAAVT